MPSNAMRMGAWDELTPVLVSGWSVSVLLFTDFGTVLIPVLFSEATSSVT